jgi:uncharacterized repeat protein (TIGR03806 family)
MKNKHLIICALLLCGVVTFQCCTKFDLPAVHNNISFLEKLSDYHLFKGMPSDLQPADSFEKYEIATPLFTDYAEKQRLIKLPAGTRITTNGNGLPSFPDGTTLAKTFYYFLDNRDPAIGKRLIETRLLIIGNGQWNVATYKWNDAQTDAFLVTNGVSENVSWITSTGETRNINYHIPSNNECGGCHRSHDLVQPIGLKLRNMNMDVSRNGYTVNQLQYFIDKGLMNSVNPSSVAKLPDWQDQSYSLEQRARAYLDINCAHCHNPGGWAKHTDASFEYERSLQSTGIKQLKQQIIHRMEADNENVRMPKLGTTIRHEEGIELVRKYLETL